MKKRINMSIQEYHEKRINNVNSRAPRKKGSIMSIQEHHVKSNVPQPSHICVIANHFDCNIQCNKSIMKKGSIMSDQKHHKKNSRSTNSRALTISRNTTPKREGLVSKYQIKSTIKKGLIMSIQEHHEKKRTNNVNS